MDTMNKFRRADCINPISIALDNGLLNAIGGFTKHHGVDEDSLQSSAEADRRQSLMNIPQQCSH